MRIFHIGWGFRPWRGGGIIEYAEDLMENQIQKGWEVLYFFSGRYFLFIKRPKLLKWKRKGILITYVEDRLGHDRGYAIDNTKKFQLDEEPAYIFE